MTWSVNCHGTLHEIDSIIKHAYVHTQTHTNVSRKVKGLWSKKELGRGLRELLSQRITYDSLWEGKKTAGEEATTCLPVPIVLYPSSHF